MDVCEEVYYVQYLYNAVAEYIYFAILYIEKQGPTNISDVIQYTKFFKHEVHEFVFMFRGKTYLEKFYSMLCATSKAFAISDGKLFLSSEYKNVKKNIFENLIITKCADLISKGIFKIQDICHNLNLSSILNVKSEELIYILSKYPYFEIQNEMSASLIQFHGLFVFENHCYETVVCYFQSYLLNIKVLSFNEIIFHAALIPSCGVQNILVVFCILYTCEIFKCKNSKISLRLKPKKKPLENRPLDIKLFETQIFARVPLGMVIYEAYGSCLRGWIGEIGKLKHNFGYIYCVVNFSDDIQDTFIVYFNQAALKQVCEVENLEDYVKINDGVKFDAVHCFEARNSNIYWKATKLKIINMPSKISKRLSRIEHCESESILPYDKSMEQKCIHPKCSLKKFHSNFYDIKKLKYCSPKSVRNECTCKDLEKYLMSESQKDRNCILEKSQVHSSLKEHYIYKIENSRENCFSSKLLTVELPLSDKCSELKLPALEADPNISCEASADNDESENSSKMFPKQSNDLMFKKNGCRYIFNFMFLEYAFMIGEITSVMLDKGTALVTHKKKFYNIFFRKEAIFPSSECQKVFQKGRKVLIFIPYIEEKKTLQVATLIHPLNTLETAEIEMSIVPAKELALNSYILNIINNVTDFQFHLPISFLLSNVFCDAKFLEYKKLLDMNSDFEGNMSKLFSFSNGMYHMLVWIILYLLYEKSLRNLKPITNIFNLLSYIASYFNIKKTSVGSYVLSKKSCSTKRKRRLLDENENNFRELKYCVLSPKDNCNRFRSSQHLYPVNLKDLETKNQDECVKSYVNNTNSSFNSFKTCGSQSSLDTFHSCESIIDEIVLDHIKECKSTSEISFLKDNDSQTLCSKNSKSDTHLLSDGNELICGSSSPKYPISKLKDSETKSIKLQTSISEHFVDCKDKSVRRISPFGILKLKSLPVFKHKLKRRQTANIKLGIYNCGYFQVVKTTASVCVITDACIFLRVKYKNYDTVLGYPTKVIPEEVKEKLKLNSVIEIEVVPNMPLHFSHVLSIKMCDTA